MIPTIQSEKDKLIYETSMRELDDFFGLNWKFNRPRVFLVPDRAAIDKLMNRKTENWVVGWTHGRDVYVLDRKNFEKESCHKYSDERYATLIKHELAHAFFHVVSKHCSKPKWLWEGVATYLSGQLKMMNKPAELKEFLGYYNKGGKGVYKEAGFAAEFLVERYGKGKLLELIRSLGDVGSEEEFRERFKEIYGFGLG